MECPQESIDFHGSTEIIKARWYEKTYHLTIMNQRKIMIHCQVHVSKPSRWYWNGVPHVSENGILIDLKKQGATQVFTPSADNALPSGSDAVKNTQTRNKCNLVYLESSWLRDVRHHWQA